MMRAGPIRHSITRGSHALPFRASPNHRAPGPLQDAVRRPRAIVTVRITAASTMHGHRAPEPASGWSLPARHTTCEHAFGGWIVRNSRLRHIPGRLWRLVSLAGHRLLLVRSEEHTSELQ